MKLIGGVIGKVGVEVNWDVIGKVRVEHNIYGVLLMKSEMKLMSVGFYW